MWKDPEREAGPGCQTDSYLSHTEATGCPGLPSTVLEVQGPLRYAAAVENTQVLD